MEWPNDGTLKHNEMYERKPLLYDFTTSSYHNRVAKLRAWEELVQEIGMPRMQLCILYLTPIVA